MAEMKADLGHKLDRYLNQDGTFRAVYEYTRKRFTDAANLTAHNWEHAYRDTINAIVVGEAENANMQIVLPAIVMHDIGFLYGGTGGTHGQVGAENLSHFLDEGRIVVEPTKLERIRSCIRTHKGSMHGEAPESLEAKVVSDADMLEKFGPVGVYQSIRTFTEMNYDAQRIIRNLSVMKDWQFQTETGRSLAEEKRAFMEEFARALQEAYKPYITEELEVKS